MAALELVLLTIATPELDPRTVDNHVVAVQHGKARAILRASNQTSLAGVN
jgi:hypothetical protein